jgi:hypothetical protein
MPRTKGTPKTGGRQKGSPNKKTAALAMAVAESGTTPLEFMLKIMHQEAPEGSAPAQIVAINDMRFRAAQAAAPYCHRRLAAVEHTGKDGAPLIEDQEVNLMETSRRICFLLASVKLKLEDDAENDKTMKISL